jgi:hypothetical protein
MNAPRQARRLPCWASHHPPRSGPVLVLRNEESPHVVRVDGHLAGIDSRRSPPLLLALGIGGTSKCGSLSGPQRSIERSPTARRYRVLAPRPCRYGCTHRARPLISRRPRHPKVDVRCSSVAPSPNNSRRQPHRVHNLVLVSTMWPRAYRTRSPSPSATPLRYTRPRSCAYRRTLYGRR